MLPSESVPKRYTSHSKNPVKATAGNLKSLSNVRGHHPFVSTGVIAGRPAKIFISDRTILEIKHLPLKLFPNNFVSY